MLAWRMILVATTLVPVITVAGCGPQQPPGPAADHGLCYQQAGCGGGSLLELPTLNECKAAGRKECGPGATQKSCTSSFSREGKNRLE